MIKQNKAQVILITLWIMIILSLLAISVANRVSLGLRLSRYARDGIKADALAMAGINRAVIEIGKDKNDYYPSREYWVEGEKKFKEIKLDDNNENEVFSIVYEEIDSDGKSSLIYGISDEDSKININAADEDLLRILLEGFKISDAGKLAKNILAWRGDVSIPPDDDSWVYTDKGYPCKKQLFTNIQELFLVKDITPEIYNTIKNYITTDTDPTQMKININTASPEVMRALLKYSINQCNLNGTTSGAAIDVNIAESLFTIINNFLKGGYFADAANLITDLQQYINGPSYSDYSDVLNQLSQYTQATSQFFHIISVGSVKKPALNRTLECVYDKATGKIISWHQN